MKTLTVNQAKTRLGGLVDEVQKGGPIVLIHGNKLAELERYEWLDPETDSPQIEAALLEAVRGPHSPYSHKKMEGVLARVSKEERYRVCGAWALPRLGARQLASDRRGR